jgi:hypothetical protein
MSSDKYNFPGITKITWFKVHNSEIKLLSIALYFFICTFYMCSNYNYQSLSGKTSRIIKFSKRYHHIPYLKSLNAANWLWTVTTDPVWHFPHQNVTKYIKVSCYSFNMSIMQYFGKYSPCTRCTCTEDIEI